MIQNEIGAIFVPVRDIEAARDWYCRILELEPSGDIHFGHIYVVPMREGSALVLDRTSAALTIASRSFISTAATFMRPVPPS